jgi:hypothetical protein
MRYLVSRRARISAAVLPERLKFAAPIFCPIVASKLLFKVFTYNSGAQQNNHIVTNYNDENYYDFPYKSQPDLR